MKKIAVLASGGGTNFQALIDGCRQGQIDGEIVLLIYNRKDAYAKNRAEQNKIPYKYINKIASGGTEKMQREVFDELSKSKADIIVLAGYLEKLGKAVVEKWESRIINIHPSLIPMFCGEGYYGLKVHEAVIKKGVKSTGCTTHFVDSDYDTGPIIMQRHVAVDPEDTPESLAGKILVFEHECLVESVALLCENRIKVVNGRVEII